MQPKLFSIDSEIKAYKDYVSNCKQIAKITYKNKQLQSMALKLMINDYFSIR